jgi:glutamate--cysteine ligase
VVVKADNLGGSAGLMSVRDAKDVNALAQKAHAAAGSPFVGVQELILQEGVLTLERMNDAVAEPVVYMMDRYVVGGFYRIHAERGIDEDLNAPGSSYVPLAFDQSTHLPQLGVRPGASAPNRFYMYGVIGRLAMLAASYELESTDPLAEKYE